MKTPTKRNAFSRKMLILANYYTKGMQWNASWEYWMNENGAEEG
ncbi:MAG: hypothetical protein Q4E55_04270 [Bacteroidales bacterium]|nr:hypothetical protein [Bacteroidales bacterium]